MSDKYPWLWVIAEGVVLEATKNFKIADEAFSQCKVAVKLVRLDGPRQTVLKYKASPGFRICPVLL